jgi:hypothetical protein
VAEQRLHAQMGGLAHAQLAFFAQLQAGADSMVRRAPAAAAPTAPAPTRACRVAAGALPPSGGGVAAAAADALGGRDAASG